MDHLQQLCTSSIVSEIDRLEFRRSELLQELRAVDEALSARRCALDDAKAMITKLKKDGKGSATPSVEQKAQAKSDSGSGASLLPHAVERTPSKQDQMATISAVARSSSTELDVKLSEKYQLQKRPSDLIVDKAIVAEERKLVKLRESDPSLLFIVEKNTDDGIVVYTLPAAATESVVQAYRITDMSDLRSVEELTTYESLVAFGAKVVPNHDREDPDIMELPELGASGRAGAIGDLIGAIELPAAPDVIIDVWAIDGSEFDGASPRKKMWATTSINGVRFCVLERIYLTSENHWGMSSVVEVSLYGRHPFTGAVVVETIAEVEDDDDNNTET